MMIRNSTADPARIALDLWSRLTSADLLVPDVILAHIVSSAEIPDGPRAGKIQFRFTLVIVNQDETWKIRSMSTTWVQPLPS